MMRLPGADGKITPKQLADGVAFAEDMGVHMHAACLANAPVHLECTAAGATWKSGVDVLLLGATKNGAVCAEAVVFCDRDLARHFQRRRKQAGHLWSKLRFVGAQLVAYFDKGRWLANARHANAMAAALESQGFGFYRWPLCPVSEGVAIRLVTSYATPQAHVDEFLAAARSLAHG